MSHAACDLRPPSHLERVAGILDAQLAAQARRTQRNGVSRWLVDLITGLLAFLPLK